MNCQRAQEQMSERLDGLLAGQQAQAFEAHLQGCALCRQEWAELEASWRLLGQLPELEPGPLFRARVWEKIRQQPDSAPSMWNWRSWLVPALTFGVLLLGWQFLVRPPRPEPGATPSATLAVEVARPDFDEWNLEVEVLPPMGALAESQRAVDDVVPLGDLSHDYLAHGSDALDEMLEEM